MKNKPVKPFLYQVTYVENGQQMSFQGKARDVIIHILDTQIKYK
jgi:hypothetical protein|tara:strand:+ start:1461 stop:1592 length:132 start_codon:yes stop_codon:yes gene_type:complete